MVHAVSPCSPRYNGPVPARGAIAIASIMFLMPVLIGSLVGLMNSWSGFLDAAFMDMTLTLEDFNYGFGPANCGGLHECGNATFESYQQARLISYVLFILALVAVAMKDMMEAAFGTDVPNLNAAESRKFPEMLKYSVLVFVVLMIFPPVWDFSAGMMNNVGVWILNPHYNLAGKGEYVHGEAGHGEMCSGEITYDEMVALARYVRWGDSWAVYRDGGKDPKLGGSPSLYSEADNYLIQDGEVLTRDCLHNVEHSSCPWKANVYADPAPQPATPPGTEIGDVLCNPDYRVKYVFQQAIGITERTAAPATPEQMLQSVSGIGGDDIMVTMLTQFIKSSVTLQVVMVVFMTGVMVDVVTSFALAIIPIVPFYRFLPMSNKVKLGDYSGAAFALLFMPLVASLILVAGAGAVATMAVDEGEGFDLFFTWLTALSVVLLVIGIPSTMVPLIGAGVAQATAAVQTGVQTAQFAGTAMVASAGGAIRGARASGEYSRLKNMTGPKTQDQQTRFNQLKEQGYGGMSRAHAALSGGMGGARSQMFDEKGNPTQKFQSAVAPGTGNITGESVRGLMDGSGVSDTTKSVSGITDGLMGAATGMAGATAGEVRKGRKPGKEELAKEAARQKAEAEKEKAEKEKAVEDAKADLAEEAGEHAGVGRMFEAERLMGVEAAARRGAEGAIGKLTGQRAGAAAKLEDAEHARTSLEKDLVKTKRDLTNAVQMQADTLAEMKRNGETLNDLKVERAKISDDLTDLQKDRAAAEKSLKDAQDAQAAAEKAKDQAGAARAAADAKDAQSKLDSLTNQVTEMDDKHTQALDRIRTADGSKVAELKENIGTIDGDIKEQTKTIESLNKNVQKLDGDIAAQAAAMERASGAMERHKIEAATANSELVQEATKLQQNPEAYTGTLTEGQAAAILAHSAAMTSAHVADHSLAAAKSRAEGLQAEVEQGPPKRQDKAKRSSGGKGGKGGKGGGGAKGRDGGGPGSH